MTPAVEPSHEDYEGPRRPEAFAAKPKRPRRPLAVDVGDVICTRTPKGWPGYLIRLGAALRDRPSTVNHVIVVWKRDDAGTLWGIQGQPGGVNQVDVRLALKAPYTITNAAQPKTEVQRYVIASEAEAFLGKEYDWTGIALDAMDAIGAHNLWRSKWGKDGVPPAHVVCSSMADWLYDHVGLASPGGRFDRRVTPGDWAAWIMEEGWRHV